MLANFALRGEVWLCGNCSAAKKLYNKSFLYILGEIIVITGE